MRSILDYIKVFKNIETYKGRESRSVDSEPRNNFNVGGGADVTLKTGIDDNFWIDHYRKVIDARLGAMEAVRKRGEPTNPDDAKYLFEQYNELKKYGGDVLEFDQRIRNLSPSAKEPEFAAHGGRIGQLVQNTVDGSRPGYDGRKVPWNKGISDPSKFTYTSTGKKIYKSTKDLIKKMGSTTVPFYSERKQMWGIRQSMQEGEKQSVIWKKKKSDINKFIKKQGGEALSRMEEARTTGQVKRIANEKKYLNSLENWTDNWFKQNKFDNVRDIDKATNKLKKDFAKAKIVKPEGVVRAAAIEGFPNIPDAGKQLKKGEAAFQKSYYRKRFLNNVLDNNPLLEKRVNNYFDYVIKDKSSLKAIQEGGYKNLQQLKIAYDDMFKNMDDIMFLLSQEDTGLYGAGKYDFLNKRFKNYDNYAKKVNTSGITYLNNIKKIEDTLGPRQLKQLLNGETSIIKFMATQQSDLAQIFDVKQLPPELRFSLDHNIGVADISRMDKSQMAKYVNSYIGTTVKRNTELGLRGFSSKKPKLIKNINAGIDVKENLAKLNKITKIAYPETLGKNPYKMVGGKVDVTKSFIFPKTQEQLFTDYFQEISKTKKGSAAIKAQHGSLKNLLSSFWCGTKQSVAGGGRIGFSGSCPVEVKQKNFLRMTNDVATGKVTGEAAEQIAKNAGKVVAKAGSKSALASIFGPAGILFDVAFEVGSIGTDVLGGKSFNRALQDNWITGAFISGTGQEEFHKELSAKYPETKPYGQAQDLIVAYNNAQKNIDLIKQRNYRARGLKEQALAGAERDLRGIEASYNALTKQGKIMEEGSPEYENYMSAKTEFEDVAKAKSFASKQKLKFALDTPESDRFTPRYKPTGMKIDFNLPQNYTTFKPTLPTIEDLNKIWKDEGYKGTLPTDRAKEFITGEKWRQEFEQPGIRGTQDWRGATGGLAGLMKKYYD